jgi:Flp pilus assembly protein TadD/predicted enzyme related to lactoylglutathione lyase
VATIGEALQQARQLIGAGQLDRAEGIYRQLLAAAPHAAELWHEMGLVQTQLGRAQAAVGFLERATELDPASAAYHSNLGAVYRMLKRTDDAVTSFRLALACGPPPAELCNNLALALKDLGQTDDALGWFDQAARMRPDFANAHFNRGNLLLDVGRLDEAIASYRRAATLNPADAGVYCKLGVAYYDQGRLDEALVAFDRALVLQPNYAEVRRNRGLALLAQGNYQQGWSEFAWRLECEGFGKRQFAQPQWDGSPLAGRTLLVHAEQGLGDTLQFIRYVPLVEEAGGRVLTEPFQILDSGRMGVFRDPSGAVFSAWEANQHTGAQLVNEPGTWNWSTLNTPDPERARTFYGEVFGWVGATVNLGEGEATMWRLPGYADFLERSDPDLRRRHAQVGAPEGFSDAVAWMVPADGPARWSVTFAVDNADAIAARAVELGGSVLAPPSGTAMARGADLSDPQGAAFSVSSFEPR